ncbi:MAG: inositol monophosphatase family protein [Anaerolineales bacterium]
MKPTLDDLIALAKGAGEILRAGYHQTKQIDHKQEIDLVTETDKASEDYILQQINERVPRHHIVAEENGESAGDPDHTWYIDPLDGTTNFAHGLPIFSVSIAYAHQGVTTLGVVYDPIREELYRAELGQGAFLNGQRLHVSQQTELKQSLVVTGYPYDRFTNPNNNLRHTQNFLMRVQGFRRLGSAALDLCNVASGRVDGYWEVYLERYDMAAGALIAEEAGARVTKVDGTPNILAEPYSVVAANAALHSEMLKVLALPDQASSSQ